MLAKFQRENRLDNWIGNLSYPIYSRCDARACKKSEIGLTNSFHNILGPKQVLISKVIVVNFTTTEMLNY